MTGTELIARVRTITGIDMTTIRDDTNILAVINDVYHEFLDSELWPFLETSDTVDTVADTAEYTIPATVDRITAVTLELSDGPQPLELVPLRYIDRYVDAEDTDEPTVYAISSGTQLTLAPTPDAVYTVQVRGVTSGDDILAAESPLFDARYHAGLAYGAAAVILNEEGQYDRADRNAMRAASYLARMHDHYIKSEDREKIVMGGHPVATFKNWRGKLWPGRLR